MNEKEFLNKLADLLKEYNANIRFACSESSDTSGLINDRIVVTMNDNKILDTFDDWYLSSTNIKQILK